MFVLENVNYKNIIKYPNIKISKGLTTFIYGESGTGKSTLLKLLNGVISPNYGKIYYLEKNIENYNSIILRREVLLVSQLVYLFDMSIKDTFDEYYHYMDLKPIDEQEIQYYLNICSINIPLDTFCNVLSGGERHRIFIAINLSYSSKVLMLDEPTSALDNKNANILIQNIKSHCTQTKKTLLIVSHDKNIIQKYADKAINLSRGVLT